MSEKKTYKILTPPVLMTIVPGRDKPPALPITELRFDEVDLNEDDAAKLALNGTIDPIPVGVKNTPDPSPAPDPETIELKSESIEPIVESVTEPEVEPITPEAITESEPIKNYPPFDISKDADVVIPLILMLDDRPTLERLLQDEQSGRDRKGVKNAINEQLGLPSRP